jgi:zinc/manganese transport system permease protein
VNAATHDWSILLPALIAGLLVTATHVPLGIQVLKRGIVFIDLAIAQIAGLGVVFADWLGFEPQGWAVQVCALVSALAGALFLTWTDRRWPEVQEATIGVVFVLAATGVLLLLAANPHGGEHLRDLLLGQILWVTPRTLIVVAIVYAVLLAVIFAADVEKRRVLFYMVFACAATVSVQLVGLYLVFTTLIVPALATRYFVRYRALAAYAIAASGYLLGIFVSALTDLPTGPAVVWIMAVIATSAFLIGGRAPSPGSRPT